MPTDSNTIKITIGHPVRVRVANPEIVHDGHSGGLRCRLSQAVYRLGFALADRIDPPKRHLS